MKPPEGFALQRRLHHLQIYDSQDVKNVIHINFLQNFGGRKGTHHFVLINIQIDL